MRTLMIIAGGIVTWGVFLGAARILAKNPGATETATWAFIAVWLVAAAYNMWVGVTQAGYSVSDELPIFFVIFGVPAALAIFVKWKWL